MRSNNRRRPSLSCKFIGKGKHNWKHSCREKCLHIFFVIKVSEACGFIFECDKLLATEPSLRCVSCDVTAINPATNHKHDQYCIDPITDGLHKMLYARINVFVFWEHFELGFFSCFCFFLCFFPL